MLATQSYLTSLVVYTLVPFKFSKRIFLLYLGFLFVLQSDLFAQKQSVQKKYTIFSNITSSKLEKKTRLSLNSTSAIETSASIGNLIWNDANKNGIQDFGEKGIAGVKVYLISVENLNSISTISDVNGNYEFKNLAVGSYALAFNTPAGFQPTEVDAGTNDNLDSDADKIDGTTYIITLKANQNDTSWDAGFYSSTVQQPKESKIIGMVWEDFNANGQRENIDLPINAAKVELLDALKQPVKDLSGNLIAPMLTDIKGKYQFSNLKEGTYFLKFSTPSGFRSTVQNKGNELVDSDTDQVTGFSAEITLLEKTIIQNIDAGFFKPASIGNLVWEDLNGNGIQDFFDEKGISGVVIDLIGTTNIGEAITKTTRSNSAGQYLFEDLTPSKYTLTFTNPSRFKSTAQDQGINSNNSDVNAIGKTVEITLLSGEINTNIDAGFFKPASVGNFIWEDRNKNGYQDQSEQGIASILVSLKGINGKGEAIEKQNISDAKGKYEITDIEPGTYTLTLIKPNNLKLTAKDISKDITVDDHLDSDIDSVSNKSQGFTLSSGQINNSLDAGLYKQSVINGYLWNDTNQNGIQDSGESPLSNIDLNITGKSGDSKAFVKSAATNLEGKYIFYNIDPGFYNLSFVRPATFNTSPKDIGSDDTKDSDFLDQEIKNIMIVSGETLKFDGGFYKPVEYGSIKGTVFNDLNRNGLNDDNSFIYQNQVFLLDSLGNKIAETQTDFNGKYIFDKLIGAKYQIQFVIPSSKKITISNMGLKDNIDSDAASNGKSPFVLIDTTKLLNDSARDIQFVDTGIVPIDPFCEPFCIPFLVRKELIRKK